MHSERWRRVEDICHEALAHPLEKRAQFLEDACKGDAQLKREIESFLTYEAAASKFMHTPAAALAASVLQEHSKGTHVGRRFG